MTCKLCEIRRPRRICPGVGGEICSICCGAEREVTISCPLDCEHLLDARAHDRPPEVDQTKVPNQDIRVSEQFLAENQALVLFAGRVIHDAALGTPGAVDSDAREALEALVRTYRTRETGLYYETRPNNPLAGAIQQHFQQAVEEFRKRAAEGMARQIVRDADVLGAVVFLQRAEYFNNNGRRRGRAFLDSLRSMWGGGEEPQAASLLVP